MHVPTGLFKAMQVATGLALPKDIRIRLTKEQGMPDKIRIRLLYTGDSCWRQMGQRLGMAMEEQWHGKLVRPTGHIQDDYRSSFLWTFREAFVMGVCV